MKAPSSIQELLDGIMGPEPKGFRPLSRLNWRAHRAFVRYYLGECVTKAPFVRCGGKGAGCGKLRTPRRRARKGTCRCGSRFTTNVGTATTLEMLIALIRGR